VPPERFISAPPRPSSGPAAKPRHSGAAPPSMKSEPCALAPGPRRSPATAQTRAVVRRDILAIRPLCARCSVNESVRRGATRAFLVRRGPAERPHVPPEPHVPAHCGQVPVERSGRLRRSSIKPARKRALPDGFGAASVEARGWAPSAPPEPGQRQKPRSDGRRSTRVGSLGAAGRAPAVAEGRHRYLRSRRDVGSSQGCSA
jgi:hypothetical protein